MNFNRQLVSDKITEFLNNFSEVYKKAYALEIINSLSEKKEDGHENLQGKAYLKRYIPDANIKCASQVKYSKDGGRKTSTQYWRINQDFLIETWKKESDAKLYDEQNIDCFYTLSFGTGVGAEILGLDFQIGKKNNHFSENE